MMKIELSYAVVRHAGAVAALLLMCASLHAQGGRSGDNNLYPQPELPLLAGPEVGFGSWSNKGSFAVSDSRYPCAVFTDGQGIGPTTGAKAYIYLNNWFIIAPRLRYEARSGQFLAPLPDEPTRDASNAIVTMSQEAQADATMATFTFDAMLAADIASSGVYVMGGVGSSVLMNGFYDYSETLKSPGGMVYNDTRTNHHTLIGGHAFDTYQRFVFDLRGGLGYIYRFGRWAVNPEAFYSFPLTSALGSPDELKQTGILGSLGLLYNFGD
jgi:hypothetical protein